MIPIWMEYLQTGCIDRNTATCCFDSPEVVQLLELLASIPEGEDFYTARSEGKYAQGYEQSWQGGTVLLNMNSLRQPIDLRAIRRSDFFDNDITLTGFPMVQDAGNGGVFETPFTISLNAQKRRKHYDNKKTDRISAGTDYDSLRLHRLRQPDRKHRQHGRNRNFR